MGFIKIWVLQLFNPYIYIYIFFLVQPLFCKEITGHTRKWVEENQPNIEQSLVKRFEGKHFLDFFFSRSDLPFFRSSPESHGLDALCWSGGCNDVGERKKKKKKKYKWRENLKFLWNWKRMLEEERDMVFLALGSFTCQVSVIRIKTGDNRRC